MSDKIDFLNADTTIPGQNYCCLSFVSPEKVLKDKNIFMMTEFLKDYCDKEKLTYRDVDEKYKDFVYANGDKMQKKFDDKNEFKTSIRGLKVRGVYDSRGEAENRAKILHRMDQDHHVFVGSVGQWLPWDPEADGVEGQEYVDEGLNNLMGEYKKNQIHKDQFFEERKQEKMEDQMKAVEESKKKNAAAAAAAAAADRIEDVTEEVSDEVKGDEKVEQSVEQTISGLEGDDPWLQRKKDEEKNNCLLYTSDAADE